MPARAKSKLVTLHALASAAEARKLNVSPILKKLQASGLANVRDALKQPERLRKALGAPDAMKRRAVGLIKLAHGAGDAEIGARVLRIAGPSLAAVGRLPAG